MIKRIPKHLRRDIPKMGKGKITSEILQNNQVKTVCKEGNCPNISTCFGNGTATFLLLGDTCTRNCLYCSVNHGTPKQIDSNVEAQRIVKAINALNLTYIVLTMVTRDDLNDGGANHIIEVIKTIKENTNDIKIELLSSDFNGNMDSIYTILESEIDVFSHNLETVPRIFSKLRYKGNYKRSFSILEEVSSNFNIPTKTGIMVGLGENEEEVLTLINSVAKIGVNALTIGQYFRPTLQNIEVKEYINEILFEKYRNYGKMVNMPVVAGSYIRSSYHAAKLFENNFSLALCS